MLQNSNQLTVRYLGKNDRECSLSLFTRTEVQIDWTIFLRKSYIEGINNGLSAMGVPQVDHWLGYR